MVVLVAYHLFLLYSIKYRWVGKNWRKGGETERGKKGWVAYKRVPRSDWTNDKPMKMTSWTP